MSRSRYYAWLKCPTSKRDQEDEKLLNQIEKIHDASRKTYGRRRVTATLKNEGFNCGERRVRKLMKREGIRGAGKKKFKRTTKPSGKDYGIPNLLEQDFEVDSPNQAYVSDITYVPTRQGWVYVCTVLDLFSRKIVGWSMSDSLESKIVKDAIKMTCMTRQIHADTIFHSDRGSQYTCSKVRKMLENYGMTQSMSLSGCCYDNAVAESFFATLKKELVHKADFVSRNQAQSSIFEYVEVFYNRVRMHSSLGNKSPVCYENEWLD